MGKMRKSRAFGFIFIALFVTLSFVFSAGIISAKTVVAGIIYDGDQTNIISGANVTVNCTNGGTNWSQNTVSLSDGVYAVIFNFNGCSDVVVTSDSPSYNTMKITIDVPDQGTGEVSNQGGRSYGGGSSSLVNNNFISALTCNENWQCDAWSACVNDIQERTCTDKAGCGTTLNKPVTSLACQIGEGQQQSQTTSTNFLTGAATGITNFAKSGTGISIFAILITLALAALLFIVIKGGKGKKDAKKTVVKEKEISKY